MGWWNERMTDQESAFQLPTRAAFVVGLKRSGTSLLKSLLDGHPGLWVLPRESKTFHWREAKDPVAALLKKTKYRECFPEGSDEGAAFDAALSKRLTPEALSSVPESIRALADTVAEVRGCPTAATYWMEKTPDHLLDVSGLLRAFGPQTRVVCTIRDPRAQIASRARRRAPGEHFPISRFAYKWALADSLMEHFEANHPEFLLVRYEDTVLKTRETVERVLRHLELDWTENQLTPTREGTDWSANSSYEKKTQGITTGSLERYREQLEPSQIEEIERLLAPRMRRRGYEPGKQASAGGGAKRWLMELRAGRQASRHLKRA